MKTKKELECFLIMIELQEMTLPMCFPFRKLFIRKVLRIIRECISDMGGELIDPEELQQKIDAVFFPRILKERMTRWQVNWIVSIMNYLHYLK